MGVTATDADEVTINVHEVGKIFCLFVLWAVGAFLNGVYHPRAI
jgi:hypothetical protein